MALSGQTPITLRLRGLCARARWQNKTDGVTDAVMVSAMLRQLLFLFEESSNRAILYLFALFVGAAVEAVERRFFSTSSRCMKPMSMSSLSLIDDGSQSTRM